MRILCFASLLPLALSLAACGPNTGEPANQALFEDSFRGTGLAAAYVVGSQFTILTNVTDSHGEPVDNATVTSSNPAVLTIDNDNLGYGNAKAVGPGTADLAIVDPSGRTLQTASVVVGVPNHAQLFAYELMSVGASDADAQLDAPQIAAGGQAGFIVRYFDDGTELFGNGAAQPTGTATASVSVVPGGPGGVLESPFPALAAYDQLVVAVGSASQAAAVSLALSGGATTVVPIAITGGDAASVDVRVDEPTPSSTSQAGTIAARPLDANGRAIYGLPLVWSFGSTTQTTSQATDVGGWGAVTTNLFRYWVDTSDPVQVDVAQGSVSSSPLTAHGTAGPSGGPPDGCSVARGSERGQASGGWIVALGIGWLLAGRRGRRRVRGARGACRRSPC